MRPVLRLFESGHEIGRIQLGDFEGAREFHSFFEGVTLALRDEVVDIEAKGHFLAIL